MKILVCGGRDFDDWEFLCNVLDLVRIKKGIDLIIEGGANGADGHAAIWANKNHIPRMTFNANWQYLGNKAGPVRNANMIKFGQPDAVIAFEGGRGTANMVKQAKDAGIPVWEVKNGP